MTKRAVINIRADAETKTAIEQLYSHFGITVSDAVNLFFAQSLQEQGLPFQVKLTNSRKNAPALELLKKRIAVEATQLFGSKLKEVRLYGSYARGDYDDESDVDFAFIVDVSPEDIPGYRSALTMTADAASIDFEIPVSINCIAASQYETWRDTLPYYRALQQEGIVVNV